MAAYLNAWKALGQPQLMVFAGIPTDQPLHTQAAQDLLAASGVPPHASRHPPTNAMPLEQLEALAGSGAFAKGKSSAA